jgi:long-subunit fatty acid transport protein
MECSLQTDVVHNDRVINAGTTWKIDDISRDGSVYHFKTESKEGHVTLLRCSAGHMLTIGDFKLLLGMSNVELKISSPVQY